MPIWRNGNFKKKTMSNNVNIRNLKGERGAVTVGTGNTVVGNFAVLQIITDTTLSALGADNYSQQDGLLTSITLPAGTMLYGKFSSVSVDNGFVVCYKDV